MSKVRSFVVNNKGYCIVENKSAYSFYTPTRSIEITSLPQIKDILLGQIRSVEDAGVVNNVLSFFAGRGNNNIFYSNKGSRLYLSRSN